jgi:hypothetical protein
MNVFFPATLFAIAAVSIAPAQAAQEFSCNGPDTLTGKAIGPTTLSVSGFECAGAPQPYNALGDRATAASGQAARRAPFVVVNFKRPEPAVKVGDTVTLKGHFSVVLDPAQQMDYVVVSDAELSNPANP